MSIYRKVSIKNTFVANVRSLHILNQVSNEIKEMGDNHTSIE